MEYCEKPHYVYKHYAYEEKRVYLMWNGVTSLVMFINLYDYEEKQVYLMRNVMRSLVMFINAMLMKKKECI